jgi:hypothetical protein
MVTGTAWARAANIGAHSVLPGEASCRRPFGTGLKTDSWAVAEKADMAWSASAFYCGFKGLICFC